jgi:methionine synthase II (cobalamin-independent)
MAPKFRAEHIGSLIRPTSALASSLQGLDVKQRSERLDAAVLHILQTQVDMGITPLTNGEYPRVNFFSAFFDKLKGFEARFVSLTGGFRPEIPVIRGAAASGLFKGMPCPIATGKIEWTRFAFEEEWMQIRRAIASIAEGNVERENELLGRVKLTIPSLIVHHIRLKRGTAWTVGSGYTSDVEFFADLTAAYRQELQALYHAGCRYVQIDDPDLTYFCDESFLSALREDGIDPDVLLSTYLQAHSNAIKDRPKGLVMGIHLCRGNFTDDLWLTKGGYENIARRLFTETGYDAFFLEYETDKAGSLEPLRFLPKGKTVVLGLVSTKQPELEDLDVLEERIIEAAVFIAQEQGSDMQEVLREQIAVSPQCGFASAEHKKAVGNEERMWEKLCLVRALAERIWSS